MTRKTMPLLCAAALLALAACGKNESPPATGQAATAAPATAADRNGPAGGKGGDTRAATRKYNQYVEAYNKLVGPAGLADTYETYRKTDFQKIKPQANINFTPGWVHLSLDRFKEARAASAPGLESLDKTADALIPALDKLVVQMKDLDLYYESRAYREDAMAKGRQQDALLVANFDASTAASEQFRQALDKAQAERTRDRLAALKAEGDMVGYQTALALSQAEPLVELFGEAADLKDPARIQRADAIAAELEKTLAEQRAALSKAKAEAAGGNPPRSAHERVANSLTTMVGSYRDLKSSRSSSAHKSMVDSYNRAVESANGP